MKNIIIGLSTMLALCGAHDESNRTTEMFRKTRPREEGQTLSNPEMTLKEFIKSPKCNPDRLDGGMDQDSDQIPGQVPFSREVSLEAFPEDHDPYETDHPNKRTVMVFRPSKTAANPKKTCCVLL